MKTSVKIAIVVVAAGAVGTVAYKLANRLPSPDQTAEMQVQQILDDGGCLSCHSENPDLPFYASWPVAGNIVRSDVEKGHRQADLGAAFAALAEGRPVDEVSLAKMEKAISDGSMPVAKYYLVHWGSSITDAKKAKLLQWIHDHRVANYSNPATAPRFAGEPVQPLPDSLPTDARKAALGEMLYNDPRLSSDNTVSCASCHGLHTGGVDNRRYSEGVNGSLGGVNAPTVFNAALNFEQFWDGRAHTLADQAGGPPLNPVEMASTSWEQIIGKLKADPKFTAMFLKVYPGGYSGEAITEAIGEYEKTLITPDSRFGSLPKGRFDGDYRAGAARIRTVQREPLRDLSCRAAVGRTVVRIYGVGAGLFCGARGGDDRRGQRPFQTNAKSLRPPPVQSPGTAQRGADLSVLPRRNA